MSDIVKEITQLNKILIRKTITFIVNTTGNEEKKFSIYFILNN